MKEPAHKVVLVFECASDAHWMKDVVQFPGAVARHLGNEKALLVTKPNRFQKELKEHIDLFYYGDEEIKNIPHFEKADFSKIVYDVSWYTNACKEAAALAPVLILYPWYGSYAEGAKAFKKNTRFKNPKVILKTDAVLKLQSQQKARLKDRVRDFFLYRYIDRIVCENETDYERLRNTNPHLAKKLCYVPNCPLDIYSEQVLTAFSDRQNIFLFVGRADDEEKGLDILLNAWLEVGENIKWKLMIAGTCSEKLKEEWIEALKQKKVEDTITWMGPVEPSKLIGLYNSVKVVVCPSRKESGPIVLSEAILSGCAFIGAPVGEIADMLKNEIGLVNNAGEWKNVLTDFASENGVAKAQAKRLYVRMKSRRWSVATKELCMQLEKK